MRTDDSSRTAFIGTQLLVVWVIAGSILPGIPRPVEAAFYKCVAADGSTTYNDAPCAADESTHRLSKNAREVARLDCRIAHNFAFDALARMRQGDSTQDVFLAYGGTNKLSEDARKLINFVYSVGNNKLTSAQRIVELTTERCEAGLLGEKLDQCESFPEEFIQRFGNCVAARQTDQTILLQPPSDSASVDRTLPTLNAARPVADNARITDD